VARRSALPAPNCSARPPTTAASAPDPCGSSPGRPEEEAAAEAEGGHGEQCLGGVRGAGEPRR